MVRMEGLIMFMLENALCCLSRKSVAILQKPSDNSNVQQSNYRETKWRSSNVGLR